MKRTEIFVICGMTLLFAACTNRLAPAWYQNLQTEPNVLTVKHSAASDSLELAIQLAEEQARQRLTEQVGVHARELRSALEKEIKLNENAELLDFFNKRLKAVVTSHLYKIKVRKQNTVRREQTWHTFIVVEYPLADANQALVTEFKRNPEMYEQVKDAPSFVALEKQDETIAQQQAL